MSESISECSEASIQSPRNVSITVVTPIYNRSDTFKRTLDSVLREISIDNEYIIVSDGSEDFQNLESVYLQAGVNNQVHLLERKKNEGTCAAINYGCKHSTGDWIMFLGSDDELSVGSLKFAKEFLLSMGEEIDFVYYSMIYRSGEIRPNVLPPTELSLARYLTHINRVLGVDQELGLLIRKNRLLENPLPENHAYEDEFHLAINSKLKGIFTPLVLKIINTDAKNRASKPSMIIAKHRDVEKYWGQMQGFANVILKYWRPLVRIAPRYYFSIVRKYFRRGLLLFKNSPLSFPIYFKKVDAKALVCIFFGLFYFLLYYPIYKVKNRFKIHSIFKS